MSGEIFGCGTDGDFSFVDLDTDAAPFGQGIEVNASLDEGLGEFFSPGFQSVGPDGEGSLGFVGLEELDHFRGVEEVQEM
jgi:hypothetical protein